MDTLLVAVAAFVGFIVAYHTYGRWLARRVFALDPSAPVPSQQLRDDVDYVPTKKEVIFGHHFTSIAGTGPIVGPALAVFWGWLPALLWVVLGSVFIGAVHDFGALVVSLRNRGQTVGEIAGRLISPRARILFLITLFFALTIVLAIFGLVIALIFSFYPESVLSVWIEIPLALLIGHHVYRKGGGLLWPSILALAVMYVCIWVGVNYLPIDLTEIFDVPVLGTQMASATVIWTVVLMVYCFIASVLPVWTLLQPRDYINSHQLLLALGLLCLGLAVAGLTGQARLADSAPAVATNIPADAPPIWPFLFITVACGAVSGFHCLVSSGTSSKQLANEGDAQYVAYGAMLLEGALAVIVILACCAGVGMGKFERVTAEDGAHRYVAATAEDGQPIVGRRAWQARYDTQKGWQSFNKLGPKIGAFIEGGANFVSALGIPLELAIGIVAVLVASFAATTLDTATRLQRYVVQELAAAMHIRPLRNKYVATGVALVLAAAVAVLAGEKPGSGGGLLWPLFGATNQLLAGLAFLVTVFYLWRRNKPILFAAAPMLLMLLMPAWAMLWNLFNGETGWWWNQNTLLSSFGVGILGLQAWIFIEAVMIWPRARGVLEESLPPLSSATPDGGRSC